MVGGTSTHICLICGDYDDGIEQLRSADGSAYRTAYRVRCQRCGTYDMTLMLSSFLEKYPNTLSQDERYTLSGTARMASERGEIVELTTTSVRDLLDTAATLTPPEQADLLLRHLAKAFKPGRPVVLDPTSDYALVGARGHDGLNYITRALINDKLIERTDKSVTPQYAVTMKGFERIREMDLARAAALAWMVSGKPGWQRAKRELDKAAEHLRTAQHEEDFAAVGLCCIAALTSVAQAVYDPAKHPTLDGKTPSPADTKRMLEAYLAKELPGPENAQARKVVRETVEFNENVKHSRTSDRIRAEVCLIATESVAKMISSIAGGTDQSG